MVMTRQTAEETNCNNVKHRSTFLPILFLKWIDEMWGRRIDKHIEILYLRSTVCSLVLCILYFVQQGEKALIA